MNATKFARHGARRPGTAVMLVGILALAGYAFFSQPFSPTRAYLEADSRGVLRTVVRPKTSGLPKQKLYKPEPGLLLANRDKLNLKPVQIRRIEVIVKNWAKRKESLDQRVRSETAFLNSDISKPRSLPSIKANLGGYSETSRRYGLERESAWSQAFHVLNKTQQALLVAEISKESMR